MDHDYERYGQVLVCIADTFFGDLDPEVQDQLRAELAPVLHCTCCHNGFVHADDASWHYADDGGSPGFGQCPKCNAEACFCLEFPWDPRSECELRRITKQCREAVQSHGFTFERSTP